MAVAGVPSHECDQFNCALWARWCWIGVPGLCEGSVVRGFPPLGTACGEPGNRQCFVGGYIRYHVVELETLWLMDVRKRPKKAAFRPPPPCPERTPFISQLCMSAASEDGSFGLTLSPSLRFPVMVARGLWAIFRAGGTVEDWPLAYRGSQGLSLRSLCALRLYYVIAGRTGSLFVIRLKRVFNAEFYGLPPFGELFFKSLFVSLTGLAFSHHVRPKGKSRLNPRYVSSVMGKSWIQGQNSLLPSILLTKLVNDQLLEVWQKAFCLCSPCLQPRLGRIYFPTKLVVRNSDVHVKTHNLAEPRVFNVTG